MRFSLPDLNHILGGAERSDLGDIGLETSLVKDDWDPAKAIEVLLILKDDRDLLTVVWDGGPGATWRCSSTARYITAVARLIHVAISAAQVMPKRVTRTISATSMSI